MSAKIKELEYAAWKQYILTGEEIYMIEVTTNEFTDILINDGLPQINKTLFWELPECKCASRYIQIHRPCDYIVVLIGETNKKGVCASAATYDDNERTFINKTIKDYIKKLTGNYDSKILVDIGLWIVWDYVYDALKYYTWEMLMQGELNQMYLNEEIDEKQLQECANRLYHKQYLNIHDEEN